MAVGVLVLVTVLGLLLIASLRRRERELDLRADALLALDVERFPLEQVVEVDILTNDCGPFVEDVFLVLQTAETKLVVPQMTPAFGTLLRQLEQLPGWNDAEVIKAMACTDNAVFECYRRPPAPR